MKGFIKINLLLLLILLVAFVLRVYNLSGVPTGIHGDEASIGYNAYSLLKTLRDQDGNFLPITIDQFGDFRPAGYHYIDIPFVAVLGLNEWALRLPAAIFGSLCILAFYFLLRELFQNKKVALLGAFLLAVSPWHINISRATSESIIASFFILLATALLIRSFRHPDKKLLLLFLSFILYFISFLFYHAARFFVPAFLIPLLAILFVEFKTKRKLIIKSIAFFVILFIGLVILFTAGSGTTRPTSISLLNVPGGHEQLKRQTDEDGTQNPLITRFFHNKMYYYGRIFLSSYFIHLSGDYLFVNNGNPARYRIPWTGNMYPIELPFILIGFAILLTDGLRKKKLLYFIPLLWVAVGALPAGLTWEDIPNVQRSSLIIPGLLAIGAFGFVETAQLLNKKWVKVFLVVAGLVFLQNVLYFLHNYYYHSRIDEPWYRSAAEPELVYTLNDLIKQNYQIIATLQNNNNLIFYLFYNAYDPAKFQKMGSPREHDGLQFENILYTNSECPLQGNPGQDMVGKPNTIYVYTQNCHLPANAEVLRTIRTPDGLPAFQIVKIKPL